MDDRRTGRRFRRRLLAVMLAAGLLPLAGGGLVVGFGLSRMLSLSLGRLDPLLERAQEAARDPALSRELSQARVDLLQAELARRSLARLAPWALLAAVGASAALLVAVAVALGRALSKPVEQLAKGMLQVAAGDLSVRIPEDGCMEEPALPASPVAEARRAQHPTDELRLLVRQFNRMTAELEAQRARLQLTEELAAWQTVARGLTHELKNPLTAMRMAVARVARLGSPAATESAQLLDEQIAVLLRMTESFSQFARLPAPHKISVDLAELLRETSTLYSGGSPVPVEFVTDPLHLDGDPDQLRRAFGNLIKNALEASRPGDGPVEIEAREHAGKARVLVRDRGAGILARLDGAQLLRSLGTTKPQGSGLGLPIAQKIVHEHGGTLVLEPREGRGAQAVVELPLSGTAGTAP
jgi:nitrogen fixation/metabolism regulation signal transduction histidine kinase